MTGPAIFSACSTSRVVVPHLAPIERPVGAIAEQGARLEPFGPEAQRHHRKMHGRAAHRLAAVVAAHLQRIVAVDDAVVGPVELRLLGLVGGEILQRTEIRAGVERHDREAVLGKLAGERAAAGAGADDDEIDLFVCRDIRASAPSRRGGRHPARGRRRARGVCKRIIRHGDCSGAPRRRRRSLTSAASHGSRSLKSEPHIAARARGAAPADLVPGGRDARNRQARYRAPCAS